MIQNGQDTNSVSASSLETGVDTSEDLENIRLLASIFNSLNTLQNRLDKLSQIAKKITAI
jgi:hypothetical protein